MIGKLLSAGASGMGTRRYRLLVILAVLLEAVFLSLHQLENFRLQVVEFIATYLLASLLYLVCCFLITNSGEGPPAGRRWMGLIWTAGVLFRLTVFSLDPMLSEDLNRYRWNGKLQAAGGNPYTETPQDPRWKQLRDATYPDVNRKDLPSVYGPVLERLYVAYYRLVAAFQPDERRQVWWFKAPFALFELAVAAALGLLLSAMGLPKQWLLIYLWSPLMIVEFWAQGHNDTPAVFFLVLALTAALKQRWSWSGSWLTLATLTKFWPVVLFPFFLLQREGGRWQFRYRAALVAIPICLLVSWPYLHGITNVEDVLAGFIGGWRNNDSLYGLIYSAVGEDFDRGTAWVTRLLAVGLALLWWRQLSLARSAKWAIILLLFLSANCFPWYLSWLLPFLVIYPDSALLLWTALVSLSYHVLIGYEASGIWQDRDDMRLLEYAPVYAMLIGAALWKFVKWRRRDSVARP